MSGVIACSIGCCSGCQDCHGMSIGCHQEPCRCDQPCTCDFSVHEVPRLDCPRHGGDTDRRFDFDDPEPEPEPMFSTPCPECGSQDACAYDDEGRPLIHPEPKEGT